MVNKYKLGQMDKARKSSLKKKKIGMSQKQLAKLSEDLKEKHDRSVTAQNCVDDLKRVQTLCSNEIVVRDFYRSHGSFHDTTWTHHFGSWKEFVKRSGILETSSGEERLKKLIAKIGAAEIYVKYYKEQIVPYHGKYKKKGRKDRIKTILVISDVHDLEVDRFVLAIILDVAKRIQPDIILVNGDAFDFYELTTKYKHDPRLYRPIERMTFVREILFGGLRKACPKAQIDFSFGNHEARLIKLLADAPQIRLLLGDLPWLNMSVKDLMGLDKYKINVISKFDLKAFSNDKPEQACKENYEIYYDCYVACHEYDDKFKGMSGTHGHTHKPGVTFSKTLVSGTEKDTSWMTTGCVSKQRVEYEEGVTKYINAIGLVHIDTLMGSVQQELIHIPGDFGVVAGTYYFRSDYQHLYEKELAQS